MVSFLSKVESNKFFKYLTIEREVLYRSKISLGLFWQCVISFNEKYVCGKHNSESTTRIVSLIKDSCDKQHNLECELCTKGKGSILQQFGMKIV